MASIKKKAVLIADDQRELREMLAEKLRSLGKEEVISFSNGQRLLGHLAARPTDVELVVLDLDFGIGQPNGLEVLKEIKKHWADLPVIILTGKGSVDLAVEAVQAGAADFIEKDLYVEDKLEVEMEKVERMLAVLRENARLKAENETLGRDNTFYRTQLGQRYQIVSCSPLIQNLLEQVEQIASIPRPVLICGERGTGKELIAAALHYGSNRRERAFVKMNCAALSDTLLESELFGHEKGAFTGATQMRPGRFEAADGGTLFLDEIGNTSLDFQKNVLRVIEYQEFERTGGTQTIHVDVRVVAATNADLEREIASEKFRADLYDRLRFSVLQLPPLRARPEDIRPLVAYFTQQLCDEVPAIERRPFAEGVLATLETYAWPGNVRELKFAVERALCVAQGDEVVAEDLPPEVRGGRGVALPEGGSFDEQVVRVERGLLNGALAQVGGRQKDAARQLGLTYDRFRHLLRKYQITAK